jgi:hypothetical protein
MGTEREPHLRSDAGHLIAFNDQIVNGLLEQAQIFAGFQGLPDEGFV